MLSQSLLTCPSRVTCRVDSELAAVNTVMKQHAAVKLRRTTIMELRELPKDLNMLTAHLDRNLHRLGVSVVVEMLFFV